MNLDFPRPTVCWEEGHVPDQHLLCHTNRVSQEFFQSLFIAIQQKLALQGNSKGSFLPSSCFLDRLLPANLACQCDSFFYFISSASSSPGTQVRPFNS